MASVKFNEKLRDAIEINVVGTKKILHLAMGMKQLKVHTQHTRTRIWKFTEHTFLA